MDDLKKCPFCGMDVYFDTVYSYFRDNVIYCDGCDMVFTLDDVNASEEKIAEAWNRRADDGWISVKDRLPNVDKSKLPYEQIDIIATNGHSVFPLIYERTRVRNKVVYRWKYCWGVLYKSPARAITHWRPLPEPPKEEQHE